MTISRRQFLAAALLAGESFLSKYDGANAQSSSELESPFPGGRLVGTVPFINEGSYPYKVPVGDGLDRRLTNDLSTIGPGAKVTPISDFYIRTGCPDLLDRQSPWVVVLDGMVDKPRTFKIEALDKRSIDMGVNVMECSGNHPSIQFGLLSACRWSGVPVMELIDHCRPSRGATQVLVSGFDGHSSPSQNSVAGASWIFTLDQLREAKAFLATSMGDAPLTPDHGFPVRLLVPGWYGCTCIKWVNAITLLDDSAASTSQMREFAARTHQQGIPQLAREFVPASMDLSAMPVRIEKWLVDGRLQYNVVGIIWGGNRLTNDLLVRFSPDQPFVKVDQVERTNLDTWGFWSKRWGEVKPGTYQIALKVGDSSIRTRRLDMGYYTRVAAIS